MMIEEAAEVILASAAWTQCEECGGQGHIDDELVGGVERHRCGKCLGDCWLVNPTYVEAFGLLRLGEPFPQRPLSERELLTRTKNIMAATFKLPLEIMYPGEVNTKERYLELLKKIGL